MMRRIRQIFVLILGDEPSFVFEAENAGAAEALVRSPRFQRAFEGFDPTRSTTWNTGAAATRPASEAEAALYKDRVAEFADIFCDANRVLVAHLTNA